MVRLTRSVEGRIVIISDAIFEVTIFNIVSHICDISNIEFNTVRIRKLQKGNSR